MVQKFKAIALFVMLFICRLFKTLNFNVFACIILFSNSINSTQSITHNPFVCTTTYDVTNPTQAATLSENPYTHKPNPKHTCECVRTPRAYAHDIHQKKNTHTHKFSKFNEWRSWLGFVLGKPHPAATGNDKSIHHPAGQPECNLGAKDIGKRWQLTE